MGRTSRYQVIKRMQAEMPRGAPFCLSALSRLGISAQLAAQYVASGWLVRLAHGVYAYPNDDFNVYDALLFLQKLVPGLHVGGKTALGWQGVMHSVSSRHALVLWGDKRFQLPNWFTERFSARYVHAQLFEWSDDELSRRTLTTPPTLPEGLSVAAPERAVLELLYEVGVKQSLEEARNVFDGVRSPRKALLGRLLACCTSVKAVRLFLTWARETNLVDVDALLKQHAVRTGSSKRWIGRLDDGTLLSLKPHG